VQHSLEYIFEHFVRHSCQTFCPSDPTRRTCRTTDKTPDDGVTDAVRGQALVRHSVRLCRRHLITRKKIRRWSRWNIYTQN